MSQSSFAAMLRSLFLFPIILCWYTSFSQSPSPESKGIIHGILQDSVTRTPVEFAAIGIADAVTGKLVNGSMTDQQGAFVIENLPFGEYEVQISFIGFRNENVKGIHLTPSSPSYATGTIYLNPETHLLEEIRILGEAALIEARADKIVYNADRDVTTAGGDASDVLRKVPMLTVDFDGNVSMRGSDNVKILINGRPSAMFNSSVADALKMMPADQIQSVEIITSPSAKYDGEGTAGIINIITRKKNVEGVAGNVDLTAGTRAHRGNANLNYGKGRFGFHISGGGHYNIPQDGRTSFRREETGTNTSLLVQDGISRSSRLGFRSNAGVEYNLNPRNTINSSFSYREYSNESENSVTSLFESGGNLIDQYERISDGMSSRAGWDWELDYKHTFPQKDKEWSVAVEIDHDDNDAEYVYERNYIFPAESETLLERNINISDNNEITIQTDFVQPLPGNARFETGLKTTLREIESDFSFLSFDPDLMTWNFDPAQTDIFTYAQNVFAGYGSATIPFGEKVSVLGGLRVELTTLEGSFQNFDSPFQNDYINFLPNLTLSKRTGEFNLIKISYNQRIQRPNQRHINPFIEYNDDRDISFGNPSLKPELIHQVELGSTFFIKGSMISVALFGRQTNDLIENLLTITNEGVSESTYYNFGNRSALGLNVFGSLTAGKFSFRGGIDFNTWKSEGDFGDEFLTNTGIDYNGRMNITWTISETLRAEGYTFYRSPISTVQGKIPTWSMMSFGIKKELFKRRLTIGISITEPFRENIIQIRELQGTGFYQYSRTARPVRSFGITAGYRFGKIDFKERSGKKRVNNNDLKDEDQGEGQF
jgi:outer membrane receptor protein involved in Fe transport